MWLSSSMAGCRAAVTERREHADGREAVYLLLWLTQPDGSRQP
ncbi:hypothetical protein ABZZ36_42210 [Actinacidiphila glaucinigra]